MADDQSEDHSHDPSDEKGQKERSPPHPQKPCGERPQSKEGSVSQTHLPRIASEDIPTLGQANIQKDKDHDIDEIIPFRQQWDQGEKEGNP